MGPPLSGWGVFVHPDVTEDSETMTQHQTLDPAQLQSWRDMLPDPKDAWVIRDIIDSFLSESASYLASLHAALQIGDVAACRSMAHRLKGGCGVIGAWQMMRLCADMEALTKAERTPLARLDASLTGIEEEYRAVRHLLEQERS